MPRETAQGRRLRILAIDVGIANMAHCLASFPELAREGTRRAAGAVELARSLLGDTRILAWDRVAIGRSSGATTAELIDMTLVYFRRHRELFLSCDEAVIEQQPAARMRNVAVALFSLLRAEGVNVRFQAAAQKLAFGAADMAAFLGGESVDTGGYRKRKDLGERLARRFLGEHDHLICDLQRFVLEKKRDDLADCFLHCLARRCSLSRARSAAVGDGGQHQASKGPATYGALDDERAIASEVEL